MKKKIIIAALIMCAVIGFHFWDQLRIFKGQVQEQVEKRIFWWPLEQVGSIRIDSATETIRLARQDDGWFLTEPVADRADEWEVRVLIDSLVYAEIEEIVSEDESDGHRFGLDRPSYRVEVQGPSGEPMGTLLFGNAIPTGVAHYAKIEGSPVVFTISTENYYVASRPSSQLRDRRIFRFSPDKVQTIQVVWDDEQELHVSRDQEKNWRLVEPVKAAADQDKINIFLGSAEGLKVHDYVSESPDDSEKYGLVSDATRVTIIEGHRGETRTLVLGHCDAQAGICFAKFTDSPSIFTIDKRFSDLVPRRTLDWRPQHPFTIEPFQVSNFKIETATSVLYEIERGDTGWTVIGPEAEKGTKLDESPVSEYLSRIFDFTIEEYLPASAEEDVALASPTMTVTARSRYQESSVLIGDGTMDGKTSAKSPEPGETYLINKAFVDALLSTPGSK